MEWMSLHHGNAALPMDPPSINRSWFTLQDCLELFLIKLALKVDHQLKVKTHLILICAALLQFDCSKLYDYWSLSLWLPLAWPSLQFLTFSFLQHQDNMSWWLIFQFSLRDVLVILSLLKSIQPLSSSFGFTRKSMQTMKQTMEIEIG